MSVFPRCRHRSGTGTLGATDTEIAYRAWDKPTRHGDRRSRAAGGVAMAMGRKRVLGAMGRKRVLGLALSLRERPKPRRAQIDVAHGTLS